MRPLSRPSPRSGQISSPLPSSISTREGTEEERERDGDQRDVAAAATARETLERPVSPGEEIERQAARFVPTDRHRIGGDAGLRQRSEERIEPRPRTASLSSSPDPFGDAGG
ncbi:hypothetical protein [Methylobacterium sp. AMS5]|uniref:hypothetical protein n=1 Tax=Methylobacterium sp. AMS5 TaxID=925818 RepID=UPI00118768D8|nr:hypothetical protein [Methylobacterium sp. AMS5]